MIPTRFTNFLFPFLFFEKSIGVLTNESQKNNKSQLKLNGKENHDLILLLKGMSYSSGQHSQIRLLHRSHGLNSLQSCCFRSIKTLKLLETQAARKTSLHVIVEEMFNTFMDQIEPFIANVTAIPILLHIDQMLPLQMFSPLVRIILVGVTIVAHPTC